MYQYSAFSYAPLCTKFIFRQQFRRITPCVEAGHIRFYRGNFLRKRAPTAERRTRHVLSLLTNLLVTFHWGWGWRRVSDRKLKRKLRASNSFEQLPATTRASVGHASPRFVRRRFSRDCFANRCKCRAWWWLSERKLLERWLTLRVWKRCYWTFFTMLLSESINLASWWLRFLKGFLWKRFGVEFGKFKDERFLCGFVRIATLENRQIA